MIDTEPSPEQLVVAVFDFDHTLTNRDSLMPFLHMVAGRWRFLWGLLRTSPALVGYMLKVIPNWKAKEAVLAHVLAGLTTEQLQTLGQRFAIQKIPTLLKQEAVDRLRWHQSQGHQTIVVSASLEAYLAPFAKAMEIDHVLGTQLVEHSGCLTGQIQGQNCYGPEKVRRLQALLGNLKRYCVYAYGDSRGDRELLAAANFPYYRQFHDPATRLHASEPLMK
ncbi:MAG: HAD-IB family hydrolase [Cyanobacteria bacterium P01_A01_bin.17]